MDVVVWLRSLGLEQYEAVFRKNEIDESVLSDLTEDHLRATQVGIGVEAVTVGDEVIGFTDRRASHAEYVVVDAQNLTRKPANVSWEVAGSLAIAGSTAYASVRAVSLKQGDTAALSGAAGGVGSITVQLARRAGAEVIGIAGQANHDWLTTVTYVDGLANRLREAAIDAFIDTYGQGYVKIAIE